MLERSGDMGMGLIFGWGFFFLLERLSAVITFSLCC